MMDFDISLKKNNNIGSISVKHVLFKIVLKDMLRMHM